MEFVSKDTTWWVFTLPAFLGFSNILQPYFLFCLAVAFVSIALLTWAFATGGVAWKNGRNQRGPVAIPGPKGLPVFGSLFSLSRGLAHRTLASMAWSQITTTQLMAFSLGSTPAVVASDPHTAREILTSPYFADRPIKQSAKSLMFTRAMGFAPNGPYWRLLRKISSSHLFAPRRIIAHEAGRQQDCATMLCNIAKEQARCGTVSLRKHLRTASLNNIMGSVFGKRYDPAGNHSEEELRELEDMVREGFEILGAFNFSDYLPWLSYFYDPFRINERCAKLVPRVRKLVRSIIEEHRLSAELKKQQFLEDHADFVDVLLSLDGDEKLEENDMIAVLWEMIFRGTDTTALLTEWAMAELILNPETQDKLYKEIHSLVGERSVTDADVARLPYLQAVVKETLRVHPPGPLLSWARLSTSDVQLSNGMVIPAGTTAMVNMWAIGQNPEVWGEAHVFKPERFVVSEGGADVDVRGRDLRLAPFGAGRRVCPGKNLGLVTASLWVAKLVQGFKWAPDEGHRVDLSELLKLSCEMKHELHGVALPRSAAMV
ncbi:putative 5-O-(4-coumaroyl)-D-quinate 3'-monooxygenase [Rosa chinensis]|uniref:Putative 5-O-(4-coumaroyl)-D-quinate 3'-monooxygenase n=1 Tax=Rosa chinensis TaxID=74649 RepID=A0A2P6QY00_ROSCH|nr:cytochrome P450 78A7 [Rosa chinensis]PRQ39078.1 putative 5-O-(4-coumaroyl)-D-quinate 3'-monooxygenase [Rosa chinensis]